MEVFTMNIDYGFLFLIIAIFLFLFSFYRERIKNKINENSSDENNSETKLRKEARTKHIDFEQLYNGSYFFVADESDSEETRKYHIKEYNLRTQTIAVENDFIERIKPMPLNSKVFESSYLFSDDEMEDIKKGWHFRGMNDRWFMYYKNDKLFIHTHDGECAFICSFRNLESGTELFEIETYDVYFPTLSKSKFDGSFKFWVPYLINSLLINFRRALINPNDVYNK
jgi:hypothetical protein